MNRKQAQELYQSLRQQELEALDAEVLEVVDRIGNDQYKLGRIQYALKLLEAANRLREELGVP